MERTEVNDHLQRLEDEYDVSILCARDFGSRAWNLAGPRSDRDVAFVFKQDALDYIQLGTQRQNIDREIEDNTFMGWNLTRFAELLAKSNPSVLEFLNSDLVYRDCGNRWDELRDYANQQFKPIALMGHYHSLAKANYNKYIESGNDPTVKRHLYVMRALLYKQWVAETHQVPPLDFIAFLDDHMRQVAFEREDGELDVTGTAQRYAEEKQAGCGGKEIGNPLQDWIETELDRGPNPENHNVRGIETEHVNAFVESFFDDKEKSGGEK